MKLCSAYLLVCLFMFSGCKQPEAEKNYFQSCLVDFYTDEPVRGVRLKVYQDFEEMRNTSSLLFPSEKYDYVHTDHNGCYTSKKLKGGIVVATPYDYYEIEEATDFPGSAFITNCKHHDMYKIKKKLDCHLTYMATPRYLNLRLIGFLPKYPNHYIRIASGVQKIVEETREGNDLILKINCLPDFQKQVKFGVGMEGVGIVEERMIFIEDERAKEFSRVEIF